MAVHIPHGSLLALNWLTALGWLIALNWVWRVAIALRNLPGVPDLHDSKYAAIQTPAPPPPTAKAICVIVPACNEQATIGETLTSLLATEGVSLEIIAIDDRSTDETGKIMDAVAAGHASFNGGPLSGNSLRVIHIAELPEGWLGKPHAMALAARQTNAEWLLFTDGDVFFTAETMRRSMNLLALKRGDHLVLYPTLILKSAGERMLMSCVQVLGIWMVRPWKIADPKAVSDSIGVGAFNLVRREAYSAVGGYESLRMEVLDDLRLGYKIKRAGYRQLVAFGPDMVRIHWGAGVRGLLNNLNKNAFAVFRYSTPKLLASCLGLVVLSLLPFLVLIIGVVVTLAPGGRFSDFLVYGMPTFVQLIAVWLLARYQRRYHGISPLFVLTFPVGVCLMLWAMVRSMIVTLKNGGVTWRGTLYPLSELRRNAGPVR